MQCAERQAHASFGDNNAAQEHAFDAEHETSPLPARCGIILSQGSGRGFVSTRWLMTAPTSESDENGAQEE